ncbi:hypothetical protein GCM10012275_03420 [Longimycelium tulufanense]|uniref:Uncharacterized protein n=1 Tax=Longimycelium tulufanense TaxID=907463 RepID=A0A8J3FSH5_9PSEU|nr:hypothetical protein [Longimycelium tulufanense]GGM35475.1 hypothetical protein GCM10012275_03420 [Longimycelium tulufanense]
MNNLAEMVNQPVRLRGVAGNAHAGAVLVVTGERPVYIEGLREWGATAGRTVEATGLLTETRVGPEPLGTAHTPAHGVPGPVYVLSHAAWTEAD